MHSDMHNVADRHPIHTSPRNYAQVARKNLDHVHHSARHIIASVVQAADSPYSLVIQQDNFVSAAEVNSTKALGNSDIQIPVNASAVGNAGVEGSNINPIIQIQRPSTTDTQIPG